MKALETQVAKLQAARLGGTISMSGNDWIWIEQEEHVKSIARLAKENAELKMRLDAAELKELQSKQAEIEKRNEQFQKQVDGLEIVSSQH